MLGDIEGIWIRQAVIVILCNLNVSQKGRVYLLDYEILDQLPANTVNGKQTYLTAPLCLLHYNENEELKPIAIQVWVSLPHCLLE